MVSEQGRKRTYLPRHVPGEVPRLTLLVDEDPHELGDGEGRVRVVNFEAGISAQMSKERRENNGLWMAL